MKVLTADLVSNAGGFVGEPVEKQIELNGDVFSVWIRRESVGLLSDTVNQTAKGVTYGIARYCNAIVDDQGNPIFSPAQMEALTEEIFEKLQAAFNEVNPQTKKA